MKNTIPALAFAAIAAFIAPPAAAVAAEFQTFQAADVVLGQPDFTTNTPVAGQPNRFANADGVALDPATGKVFVADTSHHRVLRFSSAAAAQTGSNPEAVFGQTNFSNESPNQGGSATAATLSSPIQLSVDGNGRLWVADYGNNRILGFYLASYLSNDPSADIVLGQPNPTTVTAGTTAAKMSSPYSVNVGPDDTLWVADQGNNRVLRFASITGKFTGAGADGELGQPDFTTATANTTATGMRVPAQVWPDAAGRLWVADAYNHRVLRFDGAVAKADADGASADGVLGQPDFTTSASSTTAGTFYYPYGVYEDETGALWVGDYLNNRVLRFPASVASLPSGGTADIVLGQPDFTTNTLGVTATKLGGPAQIGPGPDGSLLVAEYNNNRVTRFSPTFTPPEPKPPLISLVSRTKITTTKSQVVVKGLSGDLDGTVVAVKGNVNNGSYTTAKGVSPWKYTAKHLKPGANRIKVRAIDDDGLKSEFVRVTITRKLAAP